MLVQYHIPQFLSGVQLDRFLAGGWFRNCHLLFRSQFLCLEKDLHSVVNIRLPLQGHEFSKSQRKLLRKNKERFTFEYGPFQIDDRKDALFKKHGHRFKGFLFDSLYQFFSEDLMGQQIFDTKEICIYDNGELIAYSFFDEGKESVASLLGVFDDRYNKYSLGMYSMLLEIELAKKAGKNFYYPGYILEHPSVFDYKLRLGKMQYYDWRMARWENTFEASVKKNTAAAIRKKLLEAEEILQKAEVEYAKILYPIFSLAYLSGFEDFIPSPIFLAFDNYTHGIPFFTLLSYDLEEDVFQLIEVEKAEELTEIDEMEATTEMKDRSTYCIAPLIISKVVAKAKSMDELILYIIRRSGHL